MASGQSAALHQTDAAVVVDSSAWVSSFSSLGDLASRLGGSALVTQLWQMMHPTGTTGASEAQAALTGFSQWEGSLGVSANRMWKSAEPLWVKASFNANKSYKTAVIDSSSLLQQRGSKGATAGGAEKAPTIKGSAPPGQSGNCSHVFHDCLCLLTTSYTDIMKGEVWKKILSLGGKESD